MANENCAHGYLLEECEVCSLNRRLARLVRSANYIAEKEYLARLRKQEAESGG